MKHNSACLKFFTILVLLAFTGSFTPGIVEAQSGNPPGATPNPTGVVTIEKNHTFEDKDWPIVRTETQQTQDPRTGEIYPVQITIRQAPEGAVPAPSDGCPISNSAIATTGCTYQGAFSSTAQDAHLGGVVSNMSHYVYDCNAGLCDIYKPYKAVAWWTRSNGWSARNGSFRWGSGGSWLRCTDGSFYSHYYTDYISNPGWNGNTSYYYSWNLSWPQMQPTFGYPVTASMTSDGYSTSGYVGSMWAHADYTQ